jgi:hypothetical protein
MPPEPPSNGEYLVAAYVVTTVILLAYWIWLWRTAKKSVRLPPSGRSPRQ